MNIEQINFKNIFLIPEKKGYRVSYNMSKLKIKSPLLYIPFGIEYYNNKEILNLIITDDNNAKINFTNYIKIIENIYKQFSKNNLSNINDEQKLNLPFVDLPPDFIKDVSKKEFVHTFKSNNNNYILRSHLKNPEIYKMEGNKKIYLEKKEIIKKNCIAILELSNIWVHENKYGFVWYVTDIEITD